MKHLNVGEHGDNRPTFYRAHFLIRFAVFWGIGALVVRRLLFWYVPGFLRPEAIAVPDAHRWMGIAVNSLTELSLQLVLLGVPVLFLVAIRADRVDGARRRLLVDGFFSGLLYVSSYFLLSPPGR